MFNGFYLKKMCVCVGKVMLADLSTVYECVVC